MKTKISKIILAISFFALIFSFNVKPTNAGVNDGISWVQATADAGWDGRADHCALVYNNMFWVMGGYAVDGVGDEVNDVWFSSDGTNWTQATANAAWSDRYTFSCTVFNGKMWVIGGDTASYGMGNTPTNDVYYSTDGANWTQATASADFPARAGHRVVVYADKMWLAGGYDSGGSTLGDVWYSSDGTNWTQVIGENLPPRWAFGFQNWKGKMWVVGGFTGTTPAYSNAVYYSSDGITWTNAGEADWSARAAFGSAVYANKLWVFGGNTDSGYASDTWQSSDGVTWLREAEDNSWAARVNNNVGVVLDRLWFMGGYSTDAPNYRNDVYKSNDIRKPTFANVPGESAPINIEEGQLITEKYVTLKVSPTDNIQVQKVEFYVDDNLIGTETTPDETGVYSAVWDASQYHSDIRVVAYDINGNESDPLTRTADVDPSVYTESLPTTGTSIVFIVSFILLVLVALRLTRKTKTIRS